MALVEFMAVFVRILVSTFFGTNAALPRNRFVVVVDLGELKGVINSVDRCGGISRSDGFSFRFVWATATSTTASAPTAATFRFTFFGRFGAVARLVDIEIVHGVGFRFHRQLIKWLLGGPVSFHRFH